MQPRAMLADPGEAPAQTSTDPSRTPLDDVETPVTSAEITLVSGRRYALAAAATGDELTVKSRSGEIVLRISVTDEGPILSFSSATLDLAAARRIRLSAEEISVEAARDLSLAAGGSLSERVGGDHHCRVGGDERVEASNLQLQANTGAVTVQAMGAIALDGEHIGLNDHPAPQPFSWSAIAGDAGESGDSNE